MQSVEEGECDNFVCSQLRLVDADLEVDGSNFAEGKLSVKAKVGDLRKEGHLTKACTSDAKAGKVWHNAEKVLFSQNCQVQLQIFLDAAL